jgi:hypothetical protein
VISLFAQGTQSPKRKKGTPIMNLVLLMILISEACLGICAWVSPEFLNRIASHLLTRADVIDAARAESQRRMRYWQDTLGLSHERTGEETEALAPVRTSSPQLSGRPI